MWAFHSWRALVPTAKRIIAAHVSQFRDRADELRHGLATGKYDAYLLMPRGVRDEEFHTAVTELLSDWGSTAPVVPTVHIVSAQLDSLTVALRDFAYQMGMPAEVVTPDSATGRDVLARHGDSSVLPGRLRARRRHHAAPLRAGPRRDHLRRPGRRRRGQGRRPGRRRGWSRRAGLGGLRVL